MAFLQGFGPEGDFLRDRFDTLWVSGPQSAPRTPVAWSNAQFTPPDNASWVRFSIHHFPEGEIASFGSPGSNLRRVDGTIIVEMFAPMNVGEGALEILGDAVAAIYRDVTSQDGLRFGEPSTTNVGPQGGWYKRDVLVPFVRDTVFT